VLAGAAEDVQTAMKLLKSETANLGAPNVKREEAISGKTVPILYFGPTKMNNSSWFDEVQRKMGGTATLFVRSGSEFVRDASPSVADLSALNQRATSSRH
jgi:hypothetical protein